jgi:hypothetical protein
MEIHGIAARYPDNWQTSGAFLGAVYGKTSHAFTLHRAATARDEERMWPPLAEVLEKV